MLKHCLEHARRIASALPARMLAAMHGRTDGLTENLSILRNAIIHSVSRTRTYADFDLFGLP